ncbi:MAG TPA: aldo/keto reductase [Epsilonproteobacteria bacterium]|nr:aldo/keto reductase [Campylobacterota bacterium]
MTFTTIKQPITIPKILYGTAWKKEHTTALVKQALKAGFQAIDTACQPKHYREELVGEGIALSGIARDKLFIQTKFTPEGGQDPESIPYDPKASLDTQVKQSFEVSQKNLRTDYVDSLVLHSPLFPFANLLKVWRSMEEIAKAGQAKHIGISNCYDLKVLQKLYENAEVKPAIVQNRFYGETDYDKALRKWCKATGIVYQSFWSLTANPHLLYQPEIIQTAKKYGKTPEQIFFSYLMSQGIVPLTGTTSPQHMQEDLAVEGDWLEESEVEAITSLLE